MNTAGKLRRVEDIGDSLIFLLDASLYLAARSSGREPAFKSALEMPKSVADLKASIGFRRARRALWHKWKPKEPEDWAIGLVDGVSHALEKWESARGASAYCKAEVALLRAGDTVMEHAPDVRREIARLGLFFLPCQPDMNEDWAAWCHRLAALRCHVTDSVLKEALPPLADEVAAAGAEQPVATGKNRGNAPTPPNGDQERSVSEVILTGIERLAAKVLAYTVSVNKGGPLKTFTQLCKEAGVARQRGYDGWLGKASLAKMWSDANARSRQERGLVRPRSRCAPGDGKTLVDPKDRGKLDSSKGASLTHPRRTRRDDED